MFNIKSLNAKSVLNGLDKLQPLLENNHIKKDQGMILSLGINEDKDNKKFNYTLDCSFLNYEGYDSNKPSRTFDLPFVIVETDGFTAENAKVALLIYSKFIGQNLDQIKQYVSYNWNEYNIGLKVNKELPEDLTKFINTDELKKIKVNSDELNLI